MTWGFKFTIKPPQHYQFTKTGSTRKVEGEPMEIYLPKKKIEILIHGSKGKRLIRAYPETILRAMAGLNYPEIRESYMTPKERALEKLKQ